MTFLIILLAFVFIYKVFTFYKSYEPFDGNCIKPFFPTFLNSELNYENIKDKIAEASNNDIRVPLIQYFRKDLGDNIANEIKKGLIAQVGISDDSGTYSYYKAKLLHKKNNEPGVNKWSVEIIDTKEIHDVDEEQIIPVYDSEQGNSYNDHKYNEFVKSVQGELGDDGKYKDYSFLKDCTLDYLTEI